MRHSSVAALTFCMGLALFAAPSPAQTYRSATQPLPAPVIVRMPSTFGGRAPASMRPDRPVRVGEFATHVRSERDRIGSMQRTLAQRFARENALIAKRGAGTPVELRAARY